MVYDVDVVEEGKKGDVKTTEKHKPMGSVDVELKELTDWSGEQLIYRLRNPHNERFDVLLKKQKASILITVEPTEEEEKQRSLRPVRTVGTEEYATRRDEEKDKRDKFLKEQAQKEEERRKLLSRQDSLHTLPSLGDRVKSFDPDQAARVTSLRPRTPEGDHRPGVYRAKSSDLYRQTSAHPSHSPS